VEGQGLTPFKVASEYIICIFFLAALPLLWKDRESFDPGVFRLMNASIISAAVSELCFTQYASVYGQANMIGHFFLLSSIAFIYRAVVMTGIARPSDILFRNLKQSEEALKVSEGKYRALFDNMLDGFAYHKMIMDDAGKPVDYVFLEVNHAYQQLTGLRRSELIGRCVRETVPGFENDPADLISAFGRVALQGEVMRLERYSERLQKWFSIMAP
jgi:PAS domain S-box-containing protein